MPLGAVPSGCFRTVERQVGLMQQAVVRRAIAPGQIITYDDVDLPDTLALKIARQLYV